MEGLEASIASTKDLERTFRLDAEFFQKRFLKSADLIDGWERDHVQNLSHISDGNHFSISGDFVDEGVPYYRGKDVTGRFFVETSSPIHITRKAFDRKFMRRSHLQQGDVLLSIVGTIGELSIVGSDKAATCSCKLAILRPKSISPEFLATFLHSRHGRNQIKRLTRGAIQQGLILEDMDQLWVPAFSPAFQKRIENVIIAAKISRDNADNSQKMAENILLAPLGLNDWVPSEPLSFRGLASDVFVANRFDAQYFRPLFDEVEERLLATGEAVPLEAILQVNQRGRQPSYSESGLPVINSKHVRTNRVILTKNRFATDTATAVRIRNGDVLLNGTGVGTIGRAAAYLHDIEAIPDNHVTVLRSERVDPVYLAVFLNSRLGQLQIERQIKGSSGQVEIYPQDISKVVFWDAPENIQHSVRDAVLSAFSEQKNSSDLLAAAKRSVEIATEDGESAALVYLDRLGEVG